MYFVVLISTGLLLMIQNIFFKCVIFRNTTKLQHLTPREVSL